MIVSDTHRRHGYLEMALEQEGKIDRLLHLGDVEGGEDYIEAIADCPVSVVAGNNDLFSYLNHELEFKLGKYRIYMTHGHAYHISMGPERLKTEARRRGVDIVMFGHTHRPYFEEEADLITLNPGSISYPRQEGRSPSYMMMEIDIFGKISFEQKFL